MASRLRGWLRALYLLLPVFLLAGGIWAVGIEPGWVQQRNLQLAPADWRGPPLTIAVASDLHVGALHAGPDKLRTLVDRINAAQPDLILLPGDFVIQPMPGSTPVSPENIARELERLKAPLGVYATLGNHDWWYDGPRIRAALESAGITVLENDALPLKRAGQTLWLVGIGDHMTGHAAPAAALAKVPAQARQIVIMHDPSVADALTPAALVAFAGHTHGGQVRLPGYGALVLPGQTPRDRAYGWIPNVAAPLWVTSGIGTSILPIRFNCPPEFVILRLGQQGQS